MATDVSRDTPGSRLLLAIEAVLPIAAAQAYIWNVSHARPRWLDVLFGLVLTTAIIALALRRAARVPPSAPDHVPLDRHTFGLTSWSDQKRSAIPLLVFTVLAVVALLLWGWRTNRLRRNTDIFQALLAYPVWGLLQQAVMFGFIYPRVRLLIGARAASFATALLFAAAHCPNPLLMAGGAVMVLVFGFVWERAPALLLLALSHGIVGAVCDKALHVSMRVGFHYFEP